MRVEVEDGKYAVIFHEGTGALRAERNGEEWRDCTGDKLISALAAEVQRLRDELAELPEAVRLTLKWFEAEDDHSKADFYQRIEMCRAAENALRAAIAKAAS